MLVKETLPLPYVSYSETFISFQQDLGSPPFFCECMRDSLDAYLEADAAHASEVRAKGLKPWQHYRFNDLPAFFAIAARLLGEPPSAFLRENLRFAPRVCHRCNKMPIYAPVFYTSGRHEAVYNFGSYVSQRRFQYGVDRFGAITAQLRCPERLGALTPAVRLKRIDQEVRQEFGFPRPGINNTQETLLALIVQRLFPQSKVRRRYRAPWLGRLEIDVMIEDLRLAFEFQGVQHRQPMDHLGGEAAFEKLQVRDARKAKLCTQNGYTLLPIYEGEVTSLEDSVRHELMLAKVSHKPAPALDPIRPPWDFEIRSNSWNGRWTNHEKESFLHASSASGEWTSYGFDFGIAATFTDQHLDSISIECAGPTKNSVTMAFPPDDEMVVREHRRTRPPKEFFLTWATLDPRVRVRDANGQQTAECTFHRLPIGFISGAGAAGRF